MVSGRQPEVRMLEIRSSPHVVSAVGDVTGRLIGREGDADEAYRIDGVEHLEPFLMSVVSASDHWLYLSSTGGLTAGRVDASRCLLPYETDDRLHVGHGVTGPLTLVRAWTGGREPTLWEPFDDRGLARGCARSITKSVLGAWVELEEVDEALGLALRVRLSTSERFGFVRAVELRRLPGSPTARAEVLDGLLNLMPAGVPLGAQQATSCLVDAYKRAELDVETGLGMFSLEARISDHAEPAESLRANVVWSTGMRGADVLLSTDQLRAFREGRPVRGERLSTGRRGAYLVHAHLDLEARPTVRWQLVADVYLGHVEVEALRAGIRSGDDLEAPIAADVARGEAALLLNVASADGLQRSGDRVATAHHLANVLFNNLRGGVFERDHRISPADLACFLHGRNRPLYATHAAWVAALGELDHAELLEAASATGDPHLLRLCYEYLPLTFSRRHGDPSRPWNQFSIRVKNPDGTRLLSYEGNWRDIFQNWEALCQSFPGFLDSVIARFVNASTVDGHNPYRVTREGIDWELSDPDDPWGNIGYWGDHQVVYLVRLLEAAERARPGGLARLLDRDVFSYADVPYRLRPYEALVRDAKAAIVFDHAAEARTAERVARVGADGRFVWGPDDRVLHVNLAEKLLVPALAKLSSLVLDGGVWLNTQRPEWNDANNALVGAGVSVVTLAYLRRYLAFLADLLAGDRAFAVSIDVADWMERLRAILEDHEGCLLAKAVDDRTRRAVLDALGRAASDYRAAVYAHGLSGRTSVPAAAIRRLCRVALAYVDHSLRGNRREDGLYHAYNLVSLDGDEARLERLPEMLEGQVAILGAGLLGPEEALDVLRALFASAMVQPDRPSFLLYPARRLPGFLEKNRVPGATVAESPLLSALLAAGDATVVARDASGNVRFHPDLSSAPELAAALDHLVLDPAFTGLVGAHRAAVLAAFEGVFHHHAFTGRSGTMHKYEGIGCVYWHMVSKLLVAVQEALFRAVDTGAPDAVVAALIDAYERVRAGLGYRQTPLAYGAFPMDPYSHSPRHLGAQQPGMTGSVKEEILTRLAEVGVRLEVGVIRFTPTLVRRSELLAAATAWTIPDADGVPRTLELPAGSLGFTLCQVPVVLRAVDGPSAVTVTRRDGRRSATPGDRLDALTSAAVLARRGEIALVEVDVPDARIVRP
jgi:hypothetical protein